ncbi:MAG: hypothetical protein LUC43_01310 [Burkholderiales bacterium]|nr:hypothetical protein [Burkholderiales bacterium]
MNFKTATIRVAAIAALASLAPVSQANFFTDLFSSNKHEIVPLNISTTNLLEGEVWAFDAGKPSAYTIVSEKTKKGTRYKLDQKQGTMGLMQSQIPAGCVVSNAGKLKLETPIGVTLLSNGNVQLSYGNVKTPVEVDVKLVPYDVSGMKISEFLRTEGSQDSQAERVGNAKFPQGSIAMKSYSTFNSGEMFLPVTETFTNAKTAPELIKNFSSVPYCLGYVRREGQRPMGVLFDAKQSGPKITRGNYQLVPVRIDTIFCRPNGEPAVASGTWNLVTTNHSSAVVLSIPQNIDKRDFGVKQEENPKLEFAFIAPAKGDNVFRPGRYLAKGSTLEGKRYLFNTTAAMAIQNAMR